MHSRTFSIVGTATLLALVLAVGSAMAQTGVALKADIPFEFHAGKAALPAGEYTIQFWTTVNVVAVARTDGSAQAMVLTNGVEGLSAPDESKLMFRKYGDRYFLAQIWTQGAVRGRDLPVSKAERELVKIAAQHQIISVLAKR